MVRVHELAAYKPAHTTMSVALLGQNASASAQAPRENGHMLQGLCSEAMPLQNTQKHNHWTKAFHISMQVHNSSLMQVPQVQSSSMQHAAPCCCAAPEGLLCWVHLTHQSRLTKRRANRYGVSQQADPEAMVRRLSLVLILIGHDLNEVLLRTACEQAYLDAVGVRCSLQRDMAAPGTTPAWGRGG